MTMDRDLDARLRHDGDDDSHDMPWPTDPCLGCQHEYQAHKGYTWGPNPIEWCEGEGFDEVTERRRCACAEFVWG